MRFPHLSHVWFICLIFGAGIMSVEREIFMERFASGFFESNGRFLVTDGLSPLGGNFVSRADAESFVRARGFDGVVWRGPLFPSSDFVGSVDRVSDAALYRSFGPDRDAVWDDVMDLRKAFGLPFDYADDDATQEVGT